MSKKRKTKQRWIDIAEQAGFHNPTLLSIWPQLEKALSIAYAQGHDRSQKPQQKQANKTGCKKVAYKRERQALSAILDLEAQGRGPLYHYRCGACLKFHLTSQMKKFIKRRRR